VREVGHAVAQRILGNNESVDDVARELHEKLLLRNESTKKVVIESIYKESEEAKHNVAVFSQAPSLAEARPLLKRVCIHSFSFSYYATAHFIDVNCHRYTEHASLTNISKPATPSPDTAPAMVATAPFPRALPLRPKSLPRPLPLPHPVRSSAISQPSVHRKPRVCSARPSRRHRSPWPVARRRLGA
jgi:hypothetical protein